MCAPVYPLQRLQELHLQENSIEILEDQALTGLTSLALLDLSKNNLRTISRVTLRPVISLQVLRLTGTVKGGETLPDGFEGVGPGSNPGIGLSFSKTTELE
ncbi:hypothetical protein Chor_010619 [Crotalus horridus]